MCALSYVKFKGLFGFSMHVSILLYVRKRSLTLKYAVGEGILSLVSYFREKSGGMDDVPVLHE